jgi:phenylacetate-CoA ligase
MAEGVANISTCPEGRMRVDEDFSAVEFVPAGNGQCRIVGTNFTKPAFPLIRYDTGDLCSLDARPCACSWPGRTVAAVDGRKEDYVVTRSGAKLGRLDLIFKDLVRIREAQIRQDSIGKITLLVVGASGYDRDDERRLLDEARKRVGDDLDVELSYVDRIPRTSSGKIRFVVATVDAGRLEGPAAAAQRVVDTRGDGPD